MGTYGTQSVMSDLSSVAALIEAWPDLAAFARDAGVSYGAAKQMKRRGSVHVDYWPSLLASDRARELTLTADELMRIHARTESAA